jgi:hypothetical protein
MILYTRLTCYDEQCCGAGAVTRCGSGSDGSGSDYGIKHS